MKLPAPTQLSSEHGVELWRLDDGGSERYAVRTEPRRARMLSSLAAAEALVARCVERVKLARAH